jgi:hypothetical protein
MGLLVARGGKCDRQAPLRVTLTRSEAECGKKAGRGAEPVPGEGTGTRGARTASLAALAAACESFCVAFLT